MTDDDHHMAPMDYWENVEEYRSGEESVDLPSGVDRSDLDKTVSEIIEERTDDEWNIIGAILADRDEEGTMYLIVLRTRIGDTGDRLLDERYFTLDPTDPYADGSGYSSNGITRRISREGTLLGLNLLYSAVSDGFDHLTKKQMIEAVDGQIKHGSQALTESLADMLGLPEPGEEEPETLPDQVVCRRCNDPMDPDEGVRMTGDLGDIWVHDPECPEGGEQ